MHQVATLKIENREKDFDFVSFLGYGWVRALLVALDPTGVVLL